MRRNQRPGHPPAAISGIVENDLPTVFGAGKAAEKVLTFIDWANKMQDSSSTSQ
jgi:hypothetical protein